MEEKRAVVRGTKPGVDPVKIFTQRHTLTAVLIGPGGGTVTVSDTFLGIGQILDGFSLTETRSDAVVFTSPSGRKALLLLDNGRSN